MKPDYVELLKTVGENEFMSRFAELRRQIEEFLIAAQYITSSPETEDNVE